MSVPENESRRVAGPEGMDSAKFSCNTSRFESKSIEVAGRLPPFEELTVASRTSSPSAFNAIVFVGRAT